MATNRGSLFDPELVSDLITKVRGKSSIYLKIGRN